MGVAFVPEGQADSSQALRAWPGVWTSACRGGKIFTLEELAGNWKTPLDCPKNTGWKAMLHCFSGLLSDFSELRGGGGSPFVRCDDATALM
jgi:hypothetical protein